MKLINAGAIDPPRQNRWIKHWEGLQIRIEELRGHFSREGEAARRSLDALLPPRLSPDYELAKKLRELDCRRELPNCTIMIPQADSFGPVYIDDCDSLQRETLNLVQS